jgi:hypothetical protein
VSDPLTDDAPRACGVRRHVGEALVSRLLESVHPIVLLALAALAFWLAWELGSKPEPLPDLMPSHATGPSLDKAIAAMGQDPAQGSGR